jgi:hypothetical protein
MYIPNLCHLFFVSEASDRLTADGSPVTPLIPCTLPTFNHSHLSILLTYFEGLLKARHVQVLAGTETVPVL